MDMPLHDDYAPPPDDDEAGPPLDDEDPFAVPGIQAPRDEVTFCYEWPSEYPIWGRFLLNAMPSLICFITLGIFNALFCDLDSA